MNLKSCYSSKSLDNNNDYSEVNFITHIIKYNTIENMAMDILMA